MLPTRIRPFIELLEFGPPALPSEARRLASARDLRGLRRLARRRTPRFVFDYVEGGSGREHTARANLAAFARRRLVPSLTSAVHDASLATTLFGEHYEGPVGIAPVGLTGLMRAEGELASVRAAASRGVPFTLSTMGTRSIEDVAAAAPASRRWFQLYLRRDRDASRALLERAAAAGFGPLVLTLDTRVAGRRLRDVRNRLSIPPRLTVRTALQSAAHPAWSLDLLRTGVPSLANFASSRMTLAETVGSMFDPALAIDDLAWLRDAWRGPILVKGVLSGADARAFVDAGADGIWVSNHGGRQLDQAVTSIDAVAGVRAAVGGDVPVVLDSGVRTGLDVVTAIAAGADAVFVGRAYLYGLMAGGQAGVERALDLLGDETLNAMQLLGVRSIAELRALGDEVFAAPGAR